MPNYNLVIDYNSFKPFDISPALQVLHDYRDAYYRLEEQMNKIAEEKGEYVLPESSKYRGVMDRYNADYDAAVSDFAKGMNLENAQNIRNLRRRYSSEVAPIRTMVQNYNKYNDKLTALGPDAIVGNTYTLDDFYGGNNPAIDYRSGKDILKESATYFSGINNALMQDPTFKSILGNQYYQMTQKGGIDSATALQAALQSYNSATSGQHSQEVQQLLAHMNNFMAAQGVDNYSDEAKQRIWGKISEGLVSSIEAPNFTYQTDHSYETPSDIRKQAYQEAQMLESGYVYNPNTGKYEYDEEAAITGGKPQEATLPDGSTWTYNPKKKQWTSSNGDGVPRTTAQLIQEKNRQIDAQQKKATVQQKELWKRYGEKKLLTDEAYLTIGESFEPFEFKMDDYTGSDDEKGIRAKGFKRLQEGGAGFNGASSGKKTNGISLGEADLPAATKTEILREAQKQNPNLTMSDLVLYVDVDWFSDDHIRVCVRGTGEAGNYRGTTGNDTPQPVIPEYGGTIRDSTIVALPDSTTVRKPVGL